jgi:hypothetical protein
MSKFLKRVSLYVLAICLLGYGIIYAAILLKPGKMLGNATEYELWQYKKQLANTPFHESKNIMIGDSRTLTGLDPQIVQHNFLNLGIGGTTAFEGYITLKQFLSKNKADTLIIGYGIFHFIESDVLNKWTLLYKLPTLKDINYLEEVEKQSNITLDNQQPSFNLYAERKATFFRLPTAYRPTFIENLKQNDYNAFIIDGLRKNLGFSNVSTADSASGQNTEVDIEKERHRFIPNKVIISYIDSIYNLAIAHNIKPILTIPPINATSYRLLSGTLFWKQYLAFIEGLKRRYPKMTIDNEIVFLPNNHFADNNHLNRRGFALYSNYVRDSLIAKTPIK